MSNLETAFFASAIRDGESKESKAGNSYGTAVLAVDSGNTDERGQSIPIFVKIFGFGDLAAVAANLRKGGRCYVEGSASIGIYQPDNGPAKIDMSVKCSRLEPTQIGRNKPKREDRTEYQRPLEQDRPFDDAIGF